MPLFRATMLAAIFVIDLLASFQRLLLMLRWRC